MTSSIISGARSLTFESTRENTSFSGWRSRPECWRRCLTVANFFKRVVLPFARERGKKFVAVDHRDEHARRVRYPDDRRRVMKKIIVVGYPKSGCTWATRLVAELVGCPVGGFWQSDKKEIALEGEDRVSDFRCYKSHHQLAQLGVPPNDEGNRTVYILRDPRDIAISAANYFQFDRFPEVAALFRRMRRGEKFYRHTLYPLLAGEPYRLERMTEALLHGSAGVHNWVRVSWRHHWQPYEAAGVPIVRYEDLLATPEEQAARILRHLGLARSDEAIATAIDNQSFARKKQTLLERGETGRAKFLRVGKSGQWREKLPPPLQARFLDELSGELARWGYLDGVKEC